MTPNFNLGYYFHVVQFSSLFADRSVDFLPVSEINCFFSTVKWSVDRQNNHIGFKLQLFTVCCTGTMQLFCLSTFIVIEIKLNLSYFNPR